MDEYHKAINEIYEKDKSKNKRGVMMMKEKSKSEMHARKVVLLVAVRWLDKHTKGDLKRKWQKPY